MTYLPFSDELPLYAGYHDGSRQVISKARFGNPVVAQHEGVHDHLMKKTLDGVAHMLLHRRSISPRTPSDGIAATMISRFMFQESVVAHERAATYLGIAANISRGDDFIRREIDSLNSEYRRYFDFFAELIDPALPPVARVSYASSVTKWAFSGPTLGLLKLENWQEFEIYEEHFQPTERLNLWAEEFDPKRMREEFEAAFLLTAKDTGISVDDVPTNSDRAWLPVLHSGVAPRFEQIFRYRLVHGIEGQFAQRLGRAPRFEESELLLAWGKELKIFEAITLEEDEYAAQEAQMPDPELHAQDLLEIGNNRQFQREGIDALPASSFETIRPFLLSLAPESVVFYICVNENRDALCHLAVYKDGRPNLCRPIYDVSELGITAAVDFILSLEAEGQPIDRIYAVSTAENFALASVGFAGARNGEFLLERLSTNSAIGISDQIAFHPIIYRPEFTNSEELRSAKSVLEGTFPVMADNGEIALATAFLSIPQFEIGPATLKIADMESALRIRQALAKLRESGRADWTYHRTDAPDLYLLVNAVWETFYRT